MEENTIFWEDVFVDYLMSVVNHGDIYVWGGQGQPATVNNITKMEKNIYNRRRALNLRKKRIEQGYTNLKCYDCSGLGMYFLQNKMHIVDFDMNANNMMHKCKIISKDQILPGDWAFKVRNGNAHHIGYVYDKNSIIEARGRDWGVIIDNIDNNDWNIFGRPKYFTNPLNSYEFHSELKIGDTGEPVQKLQQLLMANQYDVGGCGADGDFGRRTEDAVKEAQCMLELRATGIANKNLITKLGGLWYQVPTWELYRELKRISPLMQGEDVINCQKALIKAGYDCGKSGADGKFGRNTENAVKLFQKDRNLVVTGIVEENTCKALGGKWLGTWILNRVLKYKHPLMKGEDVENCQIALLEKGYNCGSSGADGKYGKGTENAVKLFQKDNKLDVDGKIGPATCEALGGKWVKG